MRRVMVTLREEVGCAHFGFCKYTHTRITLSVFGSLVFFLGLANMSASGRHSACPVRRYRRAADIGYAQLPGSRERNEGLMCH